jgi:hypothetical protein
MNNILKGTLAASLMLFAASLPIVTQAQQTATLAVSGNLNGNAGANDFTGFPITSTYHVQLVNTGILIPQNIVKVNLVLPTSLEFLATYPGIPAGWTYTRVDLQTAHLVNTTDPIEVLAMPTTGIVDFNVPIRTVAATTGAATFIWGVAPTVQGSFDNWTVPSNGGNTNSGFVTVLNATALGIQFKDFVAKADASCAVNLTWKTTIESNTKSFQIERSSDGISFKSIGEVQSKAVPQEVNVYSFMDRNPGSNHNFYRIRQLTTDNKSTVSNVENVKMSCDAEAISVYPNPTEGIVYVKGLTSKGTVKIYNALGQLVIQKEIQNSVEGINMNGVADGFYQIHVMKGDESVYSTKLIKK